MKCVVKQQSGKGNLALVDKAVPEITENEILIQVKAAAICGTDVHINHWDPWAEVRMQPPTVIGHEYAGEVVKIGAKVTNVSLGDIVTSDSHLVCGSCELCRTGKGHVCRQTKIIGVHRDGAFAEYVAIPSDAAFRCNPAIPIEVSSLMEPLGAAIHTVMAFPLAAKTVAVTGCGPIGVMAVAAVKKVGAKKVIAVEPNAMRGKMAMDLGADVLVNPIADDPVKKIHELTNGQGVDVVLEFSGNAGGIKAAVSYLQSGGEMACLGLPNGDVTFDYTDFVGRGITLKGIAGRQLHTTWYQMQGLLEGGLDIGAVITHRLPLSQYQEGLRLMEAGECGKVILIP